MVNVLCLETGNTRKSNVTNPESKKAWLKLPVLALTHAWNGSLDENRLCFNAYWIDTTVLFWKGHSCSHWKDAPYGEKLAVNLPMIVKTRSTKYKLSHNSNRSVQWAVSISITSTPYNVGKNLILLSIKLD